MSALKFFARLEKSAPLNITKRFKGTRSKANNMDIPFAPYFASDPTKAWNIFHAEYGGESPAVFARLIEQMKRDEIIILLKQMNLNVGNISNISRTKLMKHAVEAYETLISQSDGGT